jgi:uncharacterized protein (TIGR03435 family)
MHVTMADFPAAIRIFLDRPVVDKTGITGTFDFRLRFAPDENITGIPPNPDEPDLPSIFTALQEQLGLKLESTKGNRINKMDN